jgi:methylamine dehydrogenase heavy chain
MRRWRVLGLLPVLAALATGLGLAARADLAPEPIGRSEVLPAPGPHWIWASDAVTRRIGLVDLESGRLLGIVNGGWGLTVGLFTGSGQVLVPETHYSRGSRGQRTDVVTAYDPTSLAPSHEVVIPAKRAINPLHTGNAALSDDDRFLAVFNMTPATSLSIVDLEHQAFAGEIETPGCSLVYGAGSRRFVMLCADGALLSVDFDDQGNAIRKQRSEPFFDVDADPVTEKAVRRGGTWYFVSFEGMVHEVDVSAAEPRFAEPWSLFGEAERAGRWRVGGRQPLAVHRQTGRLFALVHQGGPDTHKEPGHEAWVYDLARRERVQRIELRNPGLTYLGVPLEFGQDWIWPFNRLYDLLLSFAPLGVGSLEVTQDDAPILVTGSDFSGSLALYDAASGEFLRRLATGNMTTLVLQAPYGGPQR